MMDEPVPLTAAQKDKLAVMMFQAMTATERLEHFDTYAARMCTDAWREKFKQFVTEYPADVHAAGTPLCTEVLDHACLEHALFMDEKDISGCAACRTAFWDLVRHAAADWW